MLNNVTLTSIRCLRAGVVPESTHEGQASAPGHVVAVRRRRPQHVLVSAHGGGQPVGAGLHSCPCRLELHSPGVAAAATATAAHCSGRGGARLAAAASAVPSRCANTAATAAASEPSSSRLEQSGHYYVV